MYKKRRVVGTPHLPVKKQGCVKAVYMKVMDEKQTPLVERYTFKLYGYSINSIK